MQLSFTTTLDWHGRTSLTHAVGHVPPSHARTSCLTHSLLQTTVRSSVIASNGDRGLLRSRALLARFLAVGLLVALSIAKWVTPYQPSYAIPEWAYYAAALAELALAAALAFRTWAAWGLLAFGVVSMVFSLLQDGDCG